MIDPQDPLPEGSWLWRRAFTYGLSIACLVFIWFGVEALWDMRQATAIFQITRYMIGILAVLITFYMVAPSAEQIVKLIQAARTLRASIPTNTTVKADSTAGTAEAHRQTGDVPLPDDVDVAPRSRT